MRRVKRTAVIVIPKQPYIDWANSLEEGGVKLGEEFTPEHTIYLVEDIADYIIDKVYLLNKLWRTEFKRIFIITLTSFQHWTIYHRRTFVNNSSEKANDVNWL